MQGLRLPSNLCSTCRRRFSLSRFTRKSPEGSTGGSSSHGGSRAFRRTVHNHAVYQRPVLGSAQTTRRKVGAADLFTAMYATMMATAAVADASYKDLRRRDLDQRLKDARTDLARVMGESSAAECRLALDLLVEPTANPSRKTSPSPFRVVEGLTAICVPRYQLRLHGAAARQQEAHLTWLHRQYGLNRRWSAQRPPALGGLDEVQEALVSEEQGLWQRLQEQLEQQRRIPRSDVYGREPHTPVHFNRIVSAVNVLVNDLMFEASRLEFPNDIYAQRRSMAFANSPWAKIQMLRVDGYPMYQLPDLDLEQAWAARLQTADATRQVFVSWEAARQAALVLNGQPPLAAEGVADPGKAEKIARAWYLRHFKVWVGKLCHNLLVSPAPPSIHNYNALLHGFTSVGAPTLGAIVVRSLLEQTRLRPTSQTFVCLLHHYRAQGDLVGFYGLLRRLVGLDPRGANLSRRSTADVADAVAWMQNWRGSRHANYEAQDADYHHARHKREVHYARLHTWVRSHDLALAGRHVVQRATIDLPLLDAILTGLLSLGQVRHAVHVFAAFLADYGRRLADALASASPLEDAEVNARTFNQFMNCVLDAVDVPAARALLRSLAKNAGLITPLLMSEERHARKLTIKIRLLLSVASVPDVLQQTTAEKVAPVHTSASLMKTLLAHSKPTPYKADKVEDDDGVVRLTNALFVADTLQYLSRLSQILHAAQRALMALSESPRSDHDVLPWTTQLAHLDERLVRHRRERQLYRNMALLKNLDEAVAALARAIIQLTEAVMTTVVEAMGRPAEDDNGDAVPMAGKQEDLEYKAGEHTDIGDTATSHDVLPKTSWHLTDGLLLPSAYRAFLQRSSVPLALRYASYQATVEARMLEADAPATQAATEWTRESTVTTDNTSDGTLLVPPHVLALLEHHVLVDAPSVGTHLENRLREILAQALKESYADYSLETLVEAVNKKQAPAREARRQSSLGLVARYGERLRGLLRGGKL